MDGADWREALRPGHEHSVHAVMFGTIKHAGCPGPSAMAKAIEVAVGVALPKTPPSPSSPRPDSLSRELQQRTKTPLHATHAALVHTRLGGPLFRLARLTLKRCRIRGCAWHVATECTTRTCVTHHRGEVTATCYRARSARSRLPARWTDTSRQKPRVRTFFSGD